MNAVRTHTPHDEPSRRPRLNRRRVPAFAAGDPAADLLLIALAALGLLAARWMGAL
ncbi:MAG: hypothetical protein QM346_12285 [Chloroflexota bacterium]|nr:hypothetical protein [Chloroflexota bacterium]